MGDADGTDVPAGTQPPAAATASRAGRNLPAAIASGVVLGLVVYLSLFFVKWVFAVVVIAALLICARELLQAFGRNSIRLARTPLFVGTAVIPAVAYVWGPTAMIAATGAVVLSILIWRIWRGYEGYVRDVTASTFVIAYLPFMAGFLMLTLAADDGPQRVVVFILLTIANDIGGYATGVLFGKHPIAPQISPKKSWEGFAGSVALQCAVGAATFVYLLDAPWWQGVIVGLVMTVTATAGDFAESAIKRDLGVKDMGTFLPGHGGMMDRLDSLIPNAFTSWALFTLFLGSGMTGG
jgi:phosphatidate cytidylyltransferase